MADALTLDLQGLQSLLDVLGHMGFTVLGPTVRNGAVVPGRVDSLDDLPRGWGDLQEPGSYRLRRRDDEALFGYAADAVSWKSVLFPARELIWESRSTTDGFTVDAGDGRAERDLGDPPYAILGIRSCDMHALAVHDRVLRDRAQAEEVTQESYLDCWRHATRFDSRRGSALSWLLTIVHRKAVDRVRSAEAANRRDAASALLHHNREHIAQTAHIPHELKLKTFLPIVFAQMLDHAAGRRAGIVDHNVDAAERAVGLFDEGLGVGVLA